VRFADIFRIALAAVAQHKLRNILTTFGVAIGTFVLVLSLSISLGVEATVEREFHKHDQMRRVQIWPAYQATAKDVPPEVLEVKGRMSDEKRERIREARVREWSMKHARRPAVPLTRDRLQAMRNDIDHVESVLPHIQRAGMLTLDSKTENTLCAGAELNAKGYYDRLILGEYFPSADSRCVLVSEFLLYRLGITDDDDVRQVLGKTIRLEQHALWRSTPNLLLALLSADQSDLTMEESQVLRKVVDKLPEAIQKIDLTDEEKRVLQKSLEKRPSDSRPVKDVPVTAEFTIVGVIRELTKEDMESIWGLGRVARDAEVIVPLGTAEDMAFRTPYTAERGVDGVTVIVDKEENLRAVSQDIKDMGLQPFSLVEVYENVRRNILLFSFATVFLAIVALLVASLGITNTMLMSILERTHEIGVMKAVGARDRHIQLLFLVEGALIGLIGGSLGLLCGWLASFPGDALAKRLTQQQTGSPVEGSLFAFPLLLTLGVPVFACLVTTLAAVYPARRAAKVNPITALRHE
jgi:putative ABC transport system permease protein